MRASEFLIEYREPKVQQARRDGLDLTAHRYGNKLTIDADTHGRNLARVVFDVAGQTLVAQDLLVDERYRGQGIASSMYDYAKELGYRVQRSADQTDAGKQFWDKNRGEEATVWENFADGKVLDPDLYGEMLPTATVKRIVIGVMNQVDPDAKVTVKQSPEGYYIVRSEGLRLDFGITADGGEIGANIVNAYSSYKGKNVVTDIFAQCFRAAEQLWGKPTKFVVSVQQDRGDGVWQAIAKKLGAEWGGSVMENFADGKVKGRSRPGRVKRAGASCNGSVTDLRARAKRASGEKAKMYHWCANMKSGKKK
jgi:GNAT superfamily N-acetyltransferase